MILNAINSTKDFFTLYSDDPTLVNVYLTFVGFSTHCYLLFLLIMTSATSSVFSLFCGLLMIITLSFLFILTTPFLLVVGASMLTSAAMALMIQRTGESLYARVSSSNALRLLLVPIADRIPPSIGRVEVEKS
ncbi:hypothetical protein DAPK24_053190 [Pichia kluyveri]|uniref:Outer spore wall protein 5 n=1 Tax=Pichia kluyveri TaxID=36015 RepID=A0AAV5RAX0_PICKL|nr:hypothetical protein DAPK24_053190 [Pichia kluyveri]